MSRLFDDASSQYLSVSSAPATAAPLTIAAWIYCDALPNDECIVALNDGSNSHYFMLWLDTSGSAIRAYTRAGGAARYAASTAGISTSTWHHACAVFVAVDDRAAFLDGGNKGTNAQSVTPTGINTSWIGTTDGAGEFFSGRIGEVVVWNVALIDLEVWLLWMGKPPWEIRPANLVGLWLPFGDRTDRDFSGRGHHMAPTAGPTFASDAPKVVRAWRSNPQYMGRRVVGREQPSGVWVRPAGGVPITVIPRHPAAYFDGPTIF